MNSRTCSITIDETEIFYRVSGEENFISLLMIHGLAGDSRFFHNQIKYFSKSYRTIVVDLPGHGKSVYSGEISIELYNRVVEGVVENEQLKNYILLGHSMGGAISVYHYIENRDAVKALILVSTSYVLPIDRGLIDASINNLNGLIDDMIPKIFNRKTGMFLQAARKHFGREVQKTITGDLMLCSEINLEKRLAEIDVPVLVIANRHDAMVPAELSISLHSKIKGSELVVFDEYGHVPFYENSDKFNYETEKFIEGIQ